MTATILPLPVTEASTDTPDWADRNARYLLDCGVPVSRAFEEAARHPVFTPVAKAMASLSGVTDASVALILGQQP